MNTDLITKYFIHLTDFQLNQFAALDTLYKDWNDKINVISRKDIDNLYERHILHSLAIARFLDVLTPGTRIVDIGTGGGFPAVPLAILYPDVSFHLVDRIAKKLKVASSVAGSIGLKNITIQHGDIGECHEKYDYAVSRAVMPLDKLVKLVRRNISPVCRNRHPNGLVCLKGGDIADESAGIPHPVIEYPITEYFSEKFFETKEVVYVPMATKTKG